MNTMGKLMDAWFQLLSGSLIYNSLQVPVHKETAPEDQEGHYVLLRAEGEQNSSNKRSFAFDSVIVVDIVTVFQNVADRSVVESIDDQISNLILSTPYQNNLTPQTGMQILNVEMETSTYLQEGDKVNSYYRKVSRYRQRVTQTA